MMDFATPVKRRATESVVPMINVVFLLLIFFLMTSELAPPEPVEVTPPEAEGESADKAPAILYVAPDGTLAYGDLRGEAAVTAFAEAAADAPRLRADAGVEASVVARVLADLAGRGVGSVELVTVPQ